MTPRIAHVNRNFRSVDRSDSRSTASAPSAKASGRSAYWMRDSVALGLLLAQVTAALGDVRLDSGAHRGHPRDPHHVVGAELHPVERVRHHLSGAVGRSLAARRHRRSAARRQMSGWLATS